MPCQIKNLAKAARRIRKAIENNEKIVLFSDSDLDGTTSLIILEEAIKAAGGQVLARFFPDRNEEGYGFTKKGLKYLKKYAPGLLILSDCGISNTQEIKEAERLGFETIIIDHHEILVDLPSASIIVNPKQKGDKYPFKFLAACGICLKLSRELLGENIPSALEQDIFTLAAIGTIADKMPQKEDNKLIIKEGLSYFPFSSRPGLRIFFDMYPDLSSREVVQKIVSFLQITAVKKHLTESYIFLNTSNQKKLQVMLRRFTAEQKSRAEAITEIINQIKKEDLTGSLPVIIKKSKNISAALTGAIASRVYAEFKKPSFIFAWRGEIIRGSARSGKKISTTDALKKCSLFLETFGGHPPASGFSLKKKNFKSFEKCLKAYFKEKIG